MQVSLLRNIQIYQSFFQKCFPVSLRIHKIHKWCRIFLWLLVVYFHLMCCKETYLCKSAAEPCSSNSTRGLREWPIYANTMLKEGLKIAVCLHFFSYTSAHSILWLTSPKGYINMWLQAEFVRIFMQCFSQKPSVWFSWIHLPVLPLKCIWKQMLIFAIPDSIS